MLPFQSKNGITAMASLARDTRLITADSAGLFYSRLYGFIGLFRVILLFETTANLNVEIQSRLSIARSSCYSTYVWSVFT